MFTPVKSPVYGYITIGKNVLFYKTEKIVECAMKAEGKITTEIMEYLADENNPVDVKIAAINALWLGNDNYPAFLEYLKTKNSTTSEITLLTKLDASTLISLAYIKAMGNYFDVNDAMVIAQYATMKSPYSLTVNMIAGLIYAQIMMDYDFCAVFKACDRVVKDTTLTKDIDLKAIDIIMEYINLYADDCN